MSAGGWVRICRKLYDHEPFLDDLDASVFVRMIVTAQWRERTVNTRWGPVKLGPGQLLVSERDLARRFRTSRTAIRALLQRLIRATTLRPEVAHNSPKAGTIFTVVNYEQYQGLNDPQETVRDHNENHNPTTTQPELAQEQRLKTQDSRKKEEGKTESCPPGGGSGPPESGQEGRSPTTQPDLLPTAKIIPMPSSDADRAFEMWNDTAKHLGLPTVRVVCDRRRRAMNARLKEIGGLSVWREALQKVGQTPFLLGHGSRGWRANIDFMLQPTSLAKVLESSYDGLCSKPKPSALDAAEALERRWGIQGSKF